MYKSLNGLVNECLSGSFIKNSTRNFRELGNAETDLSLPLRRAEDGQAAKLFVDLGFGVGLGLVLDRHPPLPPSRGGGGKRIGSHVLFSSSSISSSILFISLI